MQVARLIVALGEDDSGRRAILQAIAAKQGIVSEHELDRLAEYFADEMLRVLAHLRGALCEIGLQGTLAPINLFEIKEEDLLLFGLEFEVALDSGVAVHVCAPSDCPGYVLEESAGSRRGHAFLMGDGGQIPNRGASSRLLLSRDLPCP